MHASIIIAHPNHSSLSHSLAREFARGLSEQGHTSQFIDLYAEQFDPILSASEQRDMANNIIRADVRRQQKALLGSQGIVLIYPIWWASMPAILQGWLQRVLSHGFAFHYQQQQRQGLLTQRVQLIINTGSNDRGLSDTYLSPMEYIFRFCGIDELHSQINWNLGMSTDKEVIEKALSTAHAAGQGFFTQQRSYKTRQHPR